jgi:hypothetical protein
MLQHQERYITYIDIFINEHWISYRKRVLTFIQPHYGPRVYSDSDINEFQEFWG